MGHDGGEVKLRPLRLAAALLALGLAGVQAPVQAQAQAPAQVGARAMAQTLPTSSKTRVETAPVALFWLNGDKLQSVALTPSTTSPNADTSTPLGSVWKLFVFSYLVAQGLEAPPYRCEAAQRRSDEEYCCDPGEAVSRDQALQRSCGPFFAPQRLQIQAGDWRRFWQAQQAPEWLWSLNALQPQTLVAVPQLLSALRQVPDAARAAARQALLPNSTTDAAVLGAWGSGPRFKTWSWTTARGERIGGAAGWLASGAPFWLGGRGTGRTVLSQQAGVVAQHLSAQPIGAVQAQADDPSIVNAQACVQVQMFTRYPLREVRAAKGAAAADGPLQGRHTLHFANGEQLSIQATPALSLLTRNGVPQLQARLALEDYVARVLDREGDARETAAARALAVAARTWLLHNAKQDGPCLNVADDSRAQRVSPNPPTAAALAAAAFTQDLVLVGMPLYMPVRYHRDQAAPGVMAWAGAVAQSRAGVGFEDILRQAYPQAVWASGQQMADCEPLPEAAAWLREREQRWRARLRQHAGFEPQAAQMQVCRLALGTPHADSRRMQIRLREWASREGRVTLVHEYLHLAFKNHPNGADEAFVERLAQLLVDT
jgi:uncharacterized protein YfaQ (DUF2300 family)